MSRSKVEYARALSEDLAHVWPRPDPGELNLKARGAPSFSWREHVVMAQKLCDREFPPIRFLVPGLFPEGVSLLVSRPKLGKSWLLLQIGSAVASEVSALVSSDDCPPQGDVLYLSLEDNDRRLQRRLTKYFGSRSECWPQRLHIVTKWRRFDQGGLDDLKAWCTSVTKPTLIMVDTLKRVRPPKTKSQTDYDADYGACEGLLQLSHNFPGLASIVAHHDRKMGADDVFDTVSGTLGLTGGVDTIAVLKRGANGVTLHIQGRDLADEVEKAVNFDRETCRWMIVGEAAEVHRSQARTKLLAALSNGPGEGLSVAELMAATKLSRSNADTTLFRMCEDGEIVRTGRGRYALPGGVVKEMKEEQERGPLQ